MDKYIKNIYDKILEISDLELQKKLWLNINNDTGMISSYIELMCTLFDDYDFDYFIEEVAIKEKLSSNTVFELKILRKMLNEYTEKDNDEEIINDVKWNTIVSQAKKVIQIWSYI